MTTVENTGGHIPSTPREAMFGMKRAAEVAGVSVSTIRRNKELLREHGAVLNPDGWQVPMSALIASGLMRRTTPPDQPAPVPRAAEAPTEDQAQERVRQLEREAMELRRRAEVAEAVARERGEALEDMRLAMRMLTAGPSTAATSAPETAPQNAPGTPGPPEPEKAAQERTTPAPAEQPAPTVDVEPEPAPQQEAPRPADTAAPESAVQQSPAEQPAPTPAGQHAPIRRRWRDWLGL